MANNLLLAIFLIGTSFLLVLPHVYLAVPVLLSVAGFFLIRQARLNHFVQSDDVRKSWTLLLCGFGYFAISGLLLALWHGDRDPGVYEKLLPFILLPAMGWTIRAYEWRVRYWLCAIGFSAAFSGINAVFEFLNDPVLRAEGATGNPIKFGHSAVVLTAICAFAAVFVPAGTRPLVWRTGFLIAASLGTLASLLSGSKGGWPALLLVALLSVYALTQKRPMWQRQALSLSGVAVIVGLATLAPSGMVTDRIVSGVGGAIHWFQSEGEVTENSVSLRFELWALGLHIFGENPGLGIGSDARNQRWSELVATNPDYAEIGVLTSADNDLIDALATGGIMGAISLAAAYLGTWLAFWRWRNHEDAEVMALARMGLMLVGCFLIFGLSVSVLGISVFRSVFVTFAVTFLSFITLRLQEIGKAFERGSE